MTFHVPERYRVTDGMMASTPDYGNNGLFHIQHSRLRRPAHVIASDGAGWEHVSVSTPGTKFCPKWETMCIIKGMFWDPEDQVIQYHPAKSMYVNTHPYTLHLWRPIGVEIPSPPMWTVG
ncbi:hypothetical protein DRQ53_07990 [bacterium]|nr:MAG: hypothetical protein DRQ53_07990 [bacterium]